MILITRKRLILSLLMILTSTGLLIFAGVRLRPGETPLIRMDRENLLFWGFVVLIFQGWIMTALFIRQRNLIGDLERIGRIGDLSNIQAVRILKKMGSLGEALKKIMADQNEIVKLRSERITALNTLIKMLCEDVDSPVVVTDVTGGVFSYSDRLLEKIGKEQEELSLLTIGDIRQDIPLAEVLSHLEKQRLPWNGPEGSGISCTPIFARDGTLHFCIWEMESVNIVSRYKALSIAAGTRQNFQKIQDVFRNRPRRKKK